VNAGELLRRLDLDLLRLYHRLGHREKVSHLSACNHAVQQLPFRRRLPSAITARSGPHAMLMGSAPRRSVLLMLIAG
jgi:hypothetical protein